MLLFPNFSYNYFTSRPVRTKTWSAEQIVRQATVGHPREYSMSSKLKANIHKFLMEELYLNAPETYCDDDSENNNDNNSSENGVQGTKAYLKNDSKNRINSTEKVESSSDESIKSDDDKCTCDKSSRHNSLRSIEEEVGSNSKKGFKLWKSIKDKRTLFGKKSNSQRSMSLPDSIMKKSMDDFEVIEESVNNSDNAQIEERKVSGVFFIYFKISLGIRRRNHLFYFWSLKMNSFRVFFNILTG